MNTRHIDENNLAGYIHRAINDAQRENMDEHLLECPTCRERLSEQERLQRHITNEIHAHVDGTDPSVMMNFTSIRPQLKTRRKSQNIWLRLSVSAPVAFALVGLILSVLGLWKIILAGSIMTSTRQFGLFPTLACFCFMMAAVEGFDKAILIRPRFIIVALVTGVLWLGSAFIGLLNIIVIRDLAIAAVVALGGKAAEATPAAMMAVLGAAMLYVGFVIGGADHHIKYLGQPSSWKLFSVTLLLQLLILILPYLVL